MAKTTIGDLRERLTFQESVKADDGYGGSIVRWNDMVTVWAAVDPISSREHFSAQQTKVDITHRVKIRSRSEIDEKMRAIWGDTILLIESIIDDGVWMEILCKEEKPQ